MATGWRDWFNIFIMRINSFISNVKKTPRRRRL